MQECCRNEFGWQEVELFISSSDGLHSVSENLLQMGLAARVKKRDRIVPLPKIPSLSLPKPNETVDVIISTPLDPNNFYVQLVCLLTPCLRVYMYIYMYIHYRGYI